MQDVDLQVLPGPPHARTKRRVLEEFLRNPFLDDDATRLACRLGEERSEVEAAAEGLCQSRFLGVAGRSGFLLVMDLAGLPTGIEPIQASDNALEVAEEDVDEMSVDAEAEFATPLSDQDRALAEEIGCILGPSTTPGLDQRQRPPAALPATIDLPGVLGDLFADSDVPFSELVEALPFGVVVLQQNGALEVANQKAASWLGIAMADLDGATFEMVTGINPLLVIEGEPPISFSLTEPHAVEVGMNVCSLSSGPAVLIIVRDVSLQEEVTRLQGTLQEEIFDRLWEEMVDPLMMIEHFLEHPEPTGLTQARAAMEQINWFLQEFLLGRRADDDRGAAATGRV